MLHLRRALPPPGSRKHPFLRKPSSHYNSPQRSSWKAALVLDDCAATGQQDKDLAAAAAAEWWC